MPITLILVMRVRNFSPPLDNQTEKKVFISEFILPVITNSNQSLSNINVYLPCTVHNIINQRIYSKK